MQGRFVDGTFCGRTFCGRTFCRKDVLKTRTFCGRTFCRSTPKYSKKISLALPKDLLYLMNLESQPHYDQWKNWSAMPSKESTKIN
jgi:hypothetical protein